MSGKCAGIYNTYLKIYCSKNIDLLKYYIKNKKYFMLKKQ